MQDLPQPLSYGLSNSGGIVGGEGEGGLYQSDSCDDWRTDRKTVFIKAESQYDLT